MESLQLAQMLADISDLSAAVSLSKEHFRPVRRIVTPQTADEPPHHLQDKKAAKGLVNANKTLPTNPAQPQQAQVHLQPPTSTPQQRPSSAASGNRFDKYGRKILTPPVMSRTNSTGPVSQGPSTPGTPRELDDDVHQASSLMTLYEIRNRLKQQDSTGLKKAREQIDALIAKNKQQQQQQGGQANGQKPERPRPVSRTYTYPRGGPPSNLSETK